MEQHQDRVTAKAEKAERCWCRKEQREEEREKRGGKKMSEWLKKSESVKGRREKMSFKNSKGAFCPFLHHSVLLVLLFRLSKHHWSLIKPELSHLHTHEETHTEWWSEMAGRGVFPQGFLKWPPNTVASLSQEPGNFNGDYLGVFGDLANGLFGASFSIFHPFWVKWANRIWSSSERPFQFSCLCVRAHVCACVYSRRWAAV